MVEYNLRLNADNLHEDLTAIRRARGTKGPNGTEKYSCTITENQEWKINLLWIDDGEHKLTVFVKGPALAVEGFLTKAGKRINFASERQDSFVKYNSKKDNGCSLELGQICGVLAQLEDGKYKSFSSENADARTAFVMCVFVASEIVRNEVLERLLIMDKYHKRWHDCLRLYQNWASVSHTINGCNADQFAEIIYGVKVGAELQKENPDQEVKDLYGDL